MEIVDYKTGQAEDRQRTREKDLQLGIYALAAREELDSSPARLVYYNLQNNECVAATRDEKQLERGARHDPGSGRRHSRARIPAAARIPLQDLRIPLSVPAQGAATRRASRLNGRRQPCPRASYATITSAQK